MIGLSPLRVVDCSTGIAGGYCSKLFADAGADVVKVESPDGDPLRQWSATGADLGGRDGALFRFLHCSKRSVVGRLDSPDVLELIGSADLLIETFDAGVIEAAGLLDRFPGLVLLSITPFGRGGPYTNRPATEFTVQAEAGSVARRGLDDMEPFHAAGRITEYVGATFAAMGALAAVWRALRTGHGEHVDVSLTEAMTIANSTYADLGYRLSGSPPVTTPPRTVELPSIEPTLDGWVGVNTNSRQQFSDFCLLIGRPELANDPELAGAVTRKRRAAEWNAIVREFTTKHTTAEIVERASKLRIPVAPVNSGRTVLDHEHLRARGVFVRNPDGDFEQPRPSYLVDGEALAPRSAAPRLGEHSGTIEARRPRRPGTAPVGGTTPALPLAGVRVIDCTAWWAGPSSTGMLACLGADVIHLESLQRPDGIRMTGFFVHPQREWWEWSAAYLGANVNKRNLTLDLAHPDGMRIMRKLVATADVVVENFSPRVFERFGLAGDAFREINPRAVLVRMPAFGLDGPWRDNVGFAQTMEQITGLAWLTGHKWDQPRIQQGPCDPLAGMHAAFAAILGLVQRDQTGTGCLVEAPMVEGALNAAAEQIIEYSAYRATMEREGNASPWAAPQGLYACKGTEQWLAISCESDPQWQSLRRVLGEPSWAADPAFNTHRGRRARHDELDRQLRAWAADRDLDVTVELLIAAGVPAAPARDHRLIDRHPQHVARRFQEEVDHPIIGPLTAPGPPFRYRSVDKWLHSAAPTLGQHNHEILKELGVDDDARRQLEADGVIGTIPTGL
jgi:crotonobetainyl-CoA:carnitine CoA-transferase CaiB-like acyl-CoA transferase